MGNYRCPPMLRLARQSPGFQNVSGLKPMLASTDGFNTTVASHNWWNDKDADNMNFFNTIAYVRIAIEDDNPGATGILWQVAQQTVIRNVTIDAGSAYIGLDISGEGFVPTRKE